jgi:hypothetical protein
MMGWTCEGRNFGGDEKFYSCADRSWGQPSLYTLDTGSNLGQSGREVALTTYSHLTPRLKKSSYIFTPLQGLYGRL